MTTSCDDWRACSADDIAPLVSAEVAAWQAQLGWDVHDAWGVIEPARASGKLPGFVARDPSGRVVGWTCFLRHRQSLQVLALVAASVAVTRALIDAVLASPEAASADTTLVCVRDAAPGLRDALGARAFELVEYRYLSVAISRGDAEASSLCRPWRGSDVDAISRLCARAYASCREVRAFAPHGTPEEWREYVASLLTTPDCGRFLPEASFVVPGATPDEIAGVVLTTHLGAGTAHIAQLAVDPAVRRAGIARRLARAAISAAADRKLPRATLLVSTGNVEAAGLYERLGFEDHATFVVAADRQPRRSSNPALATGGASTRR